MGGLNAFYWRVIFALYSVVVKHSMDASYLIQCIMIISVNILIKGIILNTNIIWSAYSSVLFIFIYCFYRLTHISLASSFCGTQANSANPEYPLC